MRSYWKKQSEKIKRVSLIHRYYNIITSKCISFSIWYHITWFCSKLWNAALSGSLVYLCGCYTNIKGIVSILNKYLIKKSYIYLRELLFYSFLNIANSVSFVMCFWQRRFIKCCMHFHPFLSKQAHKLFKTKKKTRLNGQRRI